MTLLTELRAACGDSRAAVAHDALLGLTPRWVVAPGSTGEVAAVLRLAAARQIPTVVRGSGGKLRWGPAPGAVELLLDTRRLTGVSRRPETRAAVVGAGSRLDTLASTLADHGERLAWDPPGGGTVGGAISADVHGPLRARHGAVRELIADLTIVCGDGEVRRASSDPADIPGGDLAALVSGGFGGLGVITDVTFRLHELPEARRWVVRTVTSPAEVRGLVDSVLARYPRPAAVEVSHPHSVQDGPDQLGVLLEGPQDQVAQSAARMAVRLSDGDVVVTSDPPDWWHADPFAPDDIALRITTPPPEMYAVSYVLQDLAGRATLRGRCSPEVATMLVALPGDLDPGHVGRIVEGVRHTLIARQGSCVVLHAPHAVRETVDMWGPPPDLELLAQARRAYDPTHVLAPGRHPADILCPRAS